MEKLDLDRDKENTGMGWIEHRPARHPYYGCSPNMLSHVTLMEQFLRPKSLTR